MGPLQDFSISGSRVSQQPSVTDGQSDGQKDGRTGPNQYAPSTSPKLGVLRSWGYRNSGKPEKNHYCLIK